MGHLLQFDNKEMTRAEYSRWYRNLSSSEQCHVRGRIVSATELERERVQVLIVGISRIAQRGEF